MNAAPDKAMPGAERMREVRLECAAETNARVMRCLGESAPKGE